MVPETQAEVVPENIYPTHGAIIRQVPRHGEILRREQEEGHGEGVVVENIVPDHPRRPRLRGGAIIRRVPRHGKNQLGDTREGAVEVKWDRDVLHPPSTTSHPA